jgi:hypothetical protein
VAFDDGGDLIDSATQQHPQYRGIAQGGNTCFFAAPISFLLPFMVLAPNSPLFSLAHEDAADDAAASQGLPVTHLLRSLFQSMICISPGDAFAAVGHVCSVSAASIPFSTVESLLCTAFEDITVASREEPLPVASGRPAAVPTKKPYENPRYWKFHERFPRRKALLVDVWLFAQQDVTETLRVILSWAAFNSVRGNLLVSTIYCMRCSLFYNNQCMSILVRTNIA